MTGAWRDQANGTVCGCWTEHLQADPNFPVFTSAGKFKSVFLCRRFWNLNLLLLSVSDPCWFDWCCVNFSANSLCLRLIPGLQQHQPQLLSPNGSCFVPKRPSISVYGLQPALLSDLRRFRLSLRCSLKASTEALGRRRCSSMFVCESWSPLLSPRPLSRCQFTRWANSCVYLHSCMFSNWCVLMTLLLPTLTDGGGLLVN